MSDALPPGDPADSGPKIYLLPNLMTAGNLVCGFAAALKIVEGTLIKAAAADQGPEAMAHATELFVSKVHFAIWLILASCVFDLLDGRLARLGGTDSDFGREFDSLADIVSFGVAPALMVYSGGAPERGVPLPGAARLGGRVDLPGLRRAAAGALQLPGRDESTRGEQGIHRISDPGGRGPHRHAHAVSLLAE